MIEVRCATCGKPYRVPPRFAGRTARCKVCGGELPIPGTPPAPPDDDAPLPLAPEPEPVELALASELQDKPDPPTKRRPSPRRSGSVADWVTLAGAMLAVPALAACQWFDRFPQWRWTGWFLLFAGGVCLLVFLVGLAVRVMRPTGYACVAALGLYGSIFFITHLAANATHIEFYGLSIWAILRFFTSLVLLVVGVWYLVKHRCWKPMLIALSISLAFSVILYILALTAPRSVW